MGIMSLDPKSSFHLLFHYPYLGSKFWKAGVPSAAGPFRVQDLRVCCLGILPRLKSEGIW